MKLNDIIEELVNVIEQKEEMKTGNQVAQN